MRGAILSKIAGALRLRQRVLDNQSVSIGTTKHGFNDQRDIGRSRHIALARVLVDQVFTRPYLEARGVERRAVVQHNDAVTQAVDAVLTRWDDVAAMSNAMPERALHLGDTLLMATGFSTELALRLAAYDALFGYLHPVLVDMRSWLAGPNLRAWWQTIERRAHRPIQVSRLYHRGSLESRTIRALRDGRTLPKENTVGTLADRIADHEIRSPNDERNATAAEIEFELRVACAAAEHRDAISRFLSPRQGDRLALEFHMYRLALHDMPDAAANDLLLHGTQSSSWPLISAAVTLALVDDVRDLEARKVAAVDKDPQRVFQDMAEECIAIAAQLRSIDHRVGADGPQLRLAARAERQAVLAKAAAQGKSELPPPLPRETELEERADALCLEALTTRDYDRREQLLREAVSACASSSFAHRSLADHLHRMGRVDEAIAEHRISLELNPENEEGRESLVLLLAHEGRMGDVLALTDRYNSSSVLRAAHAYALLKSGDPKTAEKLARAILETHPKQTIALRVVAECLRIAGDPHAREYEAKAELYETGARVL